MDTPDLQCCVTQCEKPLNASYWDAQYKSETIGWDLGIISPPIKSYIDSYSNKEASILIPGCGNSYEADYLLQQGFTDVTVIDIAPSLVETLKNKYQNNEHIKIILSDFFEHQGQYDLIIEQTFFCALAPSFRTQYVHKMYVLLKTNGKLAGLLFNKNFTQGPPFGGSMTEYQNTFKDAFALLQMDIAANSLADRAGMELFIEFKKNEHTAVTLYDFKGMHCASCAANITQIFNEIPLVRNVLINTDYNEVLIVSDKEIKTEFFQKAIANEEKYKIEIK